MTSDGMPSAWLLLDQYLIKRWKHQSGHEIPVECGMIDMGYSGENVHIFCRLREQRRLFPLKGRQGWGFGFFQTNHKRHERFGTVTYTAYVDELKAKLYGMLQIETVGPGYCHFPKRYKEQYFKGLVSETRKVKQVGGQQVLKWEKASGARNEPLDCRNYAYVARCAYPVDLAARHAMITNGAVVNQSVAPMRTRRRGSPGL
jgi:phage terminase large subunit GpA-like protein